MQRMRTIVNDISAAFDEHPAGFCGSFARDVVATRNYNTHFSSDLKNKALDPAGMHWASRRIILLLTVLFLMRLGIAAPRIKAALQRHREFTKLWTVAGDPR